MPNGPAPGWYTDPERPDESRYWDGERWLVPAGSEPAAPPEEPRSEVDSHLTTAGSESPTGLDKQDPGATGPNPYGNLGIFKDPAVAAVEAEKQRADHRSEFRFLLINYIATLLVSPWGFVVAAWIWFSKSKRSIRGHAFVFLVIALVFGAAAVVAALSIHSPSADSRVAADLRSLLKPRVASDVICTHHGGDAYTCGATISGQRDFATVTDDGHTIFERGISAAGTSSTPPPPSSGNGSQGQFTAAGGPPGTNGTTALGAVIAWEDVSCSQFARHGSVWYRQAAKVFGDFTASTAPNVTAATLSARYLQALDAACKSAKNPNFEPGYTVASEVSTSAESSTTTAPTAPDTSSVVTSQTNRPSDRTQPGSCGTVPAKYASGPLTVKKESAVPCSVAMRVLGDMWAGKFKEPGPNSPDYVLVDGWRCGFGHEGFEKCTRGRLTVSGTFPQP